MSNRRTKQTQVIMDFYYYYFSTLGRNVVNGGRPYKDMNNLYVSTLRNRAAGVMYDLILEPNRADVL